MHRQEFCWIRLTEAPPPPPEPPVPSSVRIGGGFYIPEIHESAVEAQKAAAERVRRSSSASLSKQKSGLTGTQDLERSGTVNLEDTLATQPDRSLSKSANLTVEDAVRRDSRSLSKSSNLEESNRRISRTLTPNNLAPVLLGRSNSQDDMDEDEEEGDGRAATMDLGAALYLEESTDPTSSQKLERSNSKLPTKFLHGEVNKTTEDDIRGAGFHFGTFTRGTSRAKCGDRRSLTVSKKPEEYLGPATVGGDGAFRVLTSDRKRRNSLPTPPSRMGSRRGSKDFSDGGYPGSDAMVALLDALGHEVVEVDRLQVQRSEATVAGKWKVELCYMYADCPTEKTVEKKVEVTVEKKVQVPVEIAKPRPLTDDIGCQTTGVWCSYCGAPGHTKANCPLLQALKRIQELEDKLNGPHHEDCQLCGSGHHLAPQCPTLRKPPSAPASTQTDPQCQLCRNFGHFAPQCPLLMIPKKEEVATARIRVGGGWLIAPQVSGLGEPGLNEAEALEVLADNHVGGCLTKDGQVSYGRSRSNSVCSRRSSVASARPDSASASRPTSPVSPPRAPTSPMTSPRRRPSSASSQVSQVSGPMAGTATTAAPKDSARVLSGGQMGPERFKQLEEERKNLSQRISNGQGKAPSTAPRGFLYGTFVQGSHDRHRLASDTGPRTMFRVYRSGITADAALDTEPGGESEEEWDSHGHDHPDHGHSQKPERSHSEQPQIVVIPAGSAVAAATAARRTGRSCSPSPDGGRCTSKHCAC